MKILTLTILLTSFQESFYWIGLYLGPVILAFLFSIITIPIAFIEKQGSISKLFERNATLKWCLFLSLAIYIALFTFKNNMLIDSELYLIALIILKLVMAIVVLEEAGARKRNKGLWFVLGLVEYHSCFIALLIGKSVYKTSSKNKNLILDLNEVYKEKIQSTKSVFGDDLTLYEKMYELKKEYDKRFNELIEIFNKEDQQDKYEKHKAQTIQKYQRALDSGVISQEEFDSKISSLETQTNKTSNHYENTSYHEQIQAINYLKNLKRELGDNFSLRNVVKLKIDEVGIYHTLELYGDLLKKFEIAGENISDKGKIYDEFFRDLV